MDLDVTFLVQAGIVLTVLASLGQILFRPMLDLMELRETSIAGAKKESQKLLLDTEAKEAGLHAQLENARRSALASRQKLIDEARSTERKLVDAARADAQKKIEGARSSLQASKKQAHEKLEGAGKDLARQIANKLLSREVA
jgi:F-type H+-transporting ATPase subunit b